jgi:hypothetical protein
LRSNPSAHQRLILLGHGFWAQAGALQLTGTALVFSRWWPPLANHLVGHK